MNKDRKPGYSNKDIQFPSNSCFCHFLTNSCPVGLDEVGSHLLSSDIHIWIPRPRNNFLWDYQWGESDELWPHAVEEFIVSASWERAVSSLWKKKKEEKIFFSESDFDGWEEANEEKDKNWNPPKGSPCVAMISITTKQKVDVTAVLYHYLQEKIKHGEALRAGQTPGSLTH